jgi:uncharacterized protein YbcC (UPF0753/DUF2309 family)
VKVTVDLSEVHAVTRAAEQKMRRVPEDMKDALDAAAAEERRTHVYNNYTHMLEKSTFASQIFTSDDEARVEYGARMHYASYVDNRGRTRVRELGERAALEIEYRFDGDADELARM